jgi:hypothetical protein
MTQEAKPVKIGPEQLEKLIEFVRRSGKPQTLETLTRRYIELLKEGK